MSGNYVDLIMSLILIAILGGIIFFAPRANSETFFQPISQESSSELR